MKISLSLTNTLLTCIFALTILAVGAKAADYYSPHYEIGQSYGECSIQSSSITIAVTGDVMAHIPLLRCAGKHDKGEKNNEGFDYLFKKVSPWIESADIASCNAEFPAADRMRQRRRMFIFNAPKAMVNALAEAGFETANLANNHSYDQGTFALPETRKAFKEAGIAPVGIGLNAKEAGSAVIIERNGFKVAMLGASRLIPKAALDDPADWPHANYFRREKMLASIRDSARRADIVVVNVHWGTEYDPTPRREELDLAKEMMEAGADIVAGHHPHVLQPVLDYVTEDGRRAIAAMSLGNFISNQASYYVYGKSRLSYGDTRGGALVRVRFEREGLKITMSGWDAVPLWTWSDRMETRACRGCPYNIQTWAIPEALSELERLIASEDTEEAKRKRLIRMREDLQERKLRILESLNAPDGRESAPCPSPVAPGIIGRSFP